MLCALLVLLTITVFRYLETRSLRWLVWAAVTLALAFITMDASFIYGGLFGVFLVLALAALSRSRCRCAEAGCDGVGGSSDEVMLP